MEQMETVCIDTASSRYIIPAEITLLPLLVKNIGKKLERHGYLVIAIVLILSSSLSRYEIQACIWAIE